MRLLRQPWSVVILLIFAVIAWGGVGFFVNWDDDSSVHAAMNATTIVPNVGSSAGGQTITISGTDLQPSNEHSWHVVTPDPTDTSNKIAMSNDGTKLAVVTGAGRIYISDDSGATWVESSPTTNSEPGYDIAMSGDGQLLVASFSDPAGGSGYGNLFISSDGGSSWVQHDPSDGWSVPSAVAVSNDGVKIAAAYYEDNVYTTNDEGAIWTPSNEYYLFSRRGYSPGMAMSNDGNKIAMIGYSTTGQMGPIATSGLVMISQDGGINWTNTSLPNKSWTGIATSADGMKIVVVGEGFVEVSEDGGTTWNDISSVIPSGTPSSVDILPNGSQFVIGTGKIIYVCQTAPYSCLRQRGAEMYPPFGFIEFTSVASSSDGTKLAATVNNGDILLGVPSVTTVKIGGVDCANVVVASDGASLTCTVPAYSLVAAAGGDDDGDGVVDVVVSNGVDRQWLFGGYTYVVEYITISSPDSVDIDEVTPTPSGAQASGVAEINVETNALNGYRLYVMVPSAINNNLYHDTSSATIPSVSGTIDSPTALGVNTWGISLSAPGSNQWFGVPWTGAGNLEIKETNQPNNDQNGDITQVYFGVKVDTTKPSGGYWTAVLWTAVAKI